MYTSSRNAFDVFVQFFNRGGAGGGGAGAIKKVAGFGFYTACFLIDEALLLQVEGVKAPTLNDFGGGIQLGREVADVDQVPK